MKYKITAIRSKQIPWSGGTFTKYEVKTDKTGDEIVELRFGKDKNPQVQMGHEVNGYIENSSYTGNNGEVFIKILKPITAEYVYQLLLKLAPGIEQVSDAKVIDPVGKSTETTEQGNFAPEPDQGNW